MNLSVKLFLENHQNYVFGPGRVELLRLVASLGSLRQAAQALGMSYRWAWGRLNDSEKALGFKLLTTGGSPAGGKVKSLTAEARELLTWYDRTEAQLTAILAQATADCPPFLSLAPSIPKKRRVTAAK